MRCDFPSKPHHDRQEKKKIQTKRKNLDCDDDDAKRMQMDTFEKPNVQKFKFKAPKLAWALRLYGGSVTRALFRPTQICHNPARCLRPNIEGMIVDFFLYFQEKSIFRS